MAWKSQFSEEQRAWIRRTQNPYASLALGDPEDDVAMVVPAEFTVTSHPLRYKTILELQPCLK